MPARDRRVLVLGEEPSRVDRLLPALRRPEVTLVRAQHASEAIRLLRQAHFDLIALILPALGAERVLTSVRAEGSACRRSGVLVVGGHDEIEPDDLALGRYANRLLPGGCGPVEFQQEAATLLAVPPRAAIAEGARLQLTLSSGEQVELRLENLSTTGMLMRANDPLAVGTIFGFALELDGQPDPIRGRARVVRVAKAKGGSDPGVGAQFLALGGEAPQRIETLVERALAEPASAALAPPAATVVETPAAPPLGASPKRPAGAPDSRQIARCREELADLTPKLDALLEHGLSRRLVVADWYVAGAELGLESIRAFAALLSALHENRRGSAETERRIADLVEVRAQLLEFGRPRQDLATRVRVLLSLRPALQRLLGELAASDAPAGGALGVPRSPIAVAQALVEIKRLVGARRSLQSLATLLEERERPRLLAWRSGTRSSPEEIVRAFAPLAASFGIELTAQGLRQGAALRETRRQIERELPGLSRRLATVHQRAFGPRFRALVSDDVEADLLDGKLQRVLAETTAAGADYLARAYAAYRHALEVIGEEPTLLERVERLGATLFDAEAAGSPPRAAESAPRPA